MPLEKTIQKLCRKVPITKKLCFVFYFRYNFRFPALLYIQFCICLDIMQIIIQNASVKSTIQTSNHTSPNQGKNIYIYSFRSITLKKICKFLAALNKNTAYGRQSISRPMRIVVLMPQEGGPIIPKNLIFLKNGEKKTPKMQKIRNVLKIDKISDTPFDQRSLIHREPWFPPCFVGQRIPKNPIFLKNGKNHPKRKNSKISRNRPKLAICPSTRGF